MPMMTTTVATGFLMLKFLSSLRGMRRGGYRYFQEQARIDDWLALIAREAAHDYALAVEIAALQRLIKGYSDTHARGMANYRAIMDVVPSLKSADFPAQSLARLRDAALKDEEGAALRAELAKVSVKAAA